MIVHTVVTLRLETTLQAPEAQDCVCWGGGGVDLPAALGVGEPGRCVRREKAQPIWRVRLGGWSVAVTCYQVERAFLKPTYFPCPIPGTGQLRGQGPCVSHGTAISRQGHPASWHSVQLPPLLVSPCH